MIPKLEDLGNPIDRPAGIDDPRPVFAVTHQAAVNALRSFAAFITNLADVVERDPWCDVMVNIHADAIDTAAEKAAEAMAIFRQTRDCQGQG